DPAGRYAAVPPDADSIRESCRHFWRVLHGDDVGKMILVSGFSIGPSLKGVVRMRFNWPEQCDEAADWVFHEVSLKRDVFHRGYLSRPGGAILTSIYSELTADELVAGPEPSIVVGSAPGLYQCYWKLAEPKPISAIRRLADRLLWRHDRLLRMPATDNHHYHNSPSIGVVKHTAATFTVQELEECLPDCSGSVAIRSRDPVPGERSLVLEGPGSIFFAMAESPTLRVSVAGAAIAALLLGGVVVPRITGVPHRSVGSVAAAVPFVRLESGVRPNYALGEVLASGKAPRSVPVAVAASVTDGRMRHPRERVPDAVAPITPDNLPTEVADLSDSARTTWQRAASVIWMVQ
ncbi:MAG TPA: hypothetical protein VI541_01775, partial [Actinomycetota bacterium]|nr:hypothetical protein [Actinomycetota bacterium]